jgi:hypothetical protein
MTAFKPGEKQRLIATYREGTGEVVKAWRESPEASRHVRPADGEWTIHEIIQHCADSEVLLVSRLVSVAMDPGFVVQSIDQDVWTANLGYNALDPELAVAVVEAVRDRAASMMDAWPDDVWRAVGSHTETGPYALTDWLRYNANHMHVHAAQIRANVQAFEGR